MALKQTLQVQARKQRILEFCRAHNRKPSAYVSEERGLARMAGNYNNPSAHSFDPAFREKYNGYKTRQNVSPFVRHGYDRTFFSQINLKNSYWAGFVAADGSVSWKHNSFGLALAAKDREHLEKFAKMIGYTGSLQHNRKTASYKLQLYSNAQWAYDLENNFNIVPDKSLVLKGPYELHDDEHIKAFLVGYIDGDGCIKVCKRDRSLILDVFSGSELLVRWVKMELERIYGLSPKKFYSYGNGHTYRVQGAAAEMILRDLAAMPIPRLQRKWSRVAEFLAAKGE
jgi:hypothetical protein